MDRLYRSRDDRMLAGVAGGLADMWGADPSLVRVIWALLVIFTGGVALLVYIVMAIVVPEEDLVPPTTEAQAFAERRTTRAPVRHSHRRRTPRRLVAPRGRRARLPGARRAPAEARSRRP